MRGRTGTALVRCAPPEPLGNELKHCYRRRSRRCEERCRKADVKGLLSARQGLGAPTSPLPYAISNRPSTLGSLDHSPSHHRFGKDQVHIPVLVRAITYPFW